MILSADAASERPLAGRRILLVEDEMILALDLSDIVESFGCKVVVASRVGSALSALLDGVFDAAMLDLNLAGDMVYPVADELDRLGVPYIFTTGYGADGIDRRYLTHDVLPKPYTTRDVQAALLRLPLGRVG
jgi:CheY-like chemotaxis protein